MAPASGPEDLLSLLHIQGKEDLSPLDIANIINNSFLEHIGDQYPNSPREFKEPIGEFTS